MTLAQKSFNLGKTILKGHYRYGGVKYGPSVRAWRPPSSCARTSTPPRSGRVQEAAHQHAHRARPSGRQGGKRRVPRRVEGSRPGSEGEAVNVIFYL